MVRRIPDLNADSRTGQATLFDTWRFHAFFTTTDPILDTVTADKTHRGHAIIEQVHADLKDSALAHLPSGIFTANAAWLVLAVIAFNLTRAAATLTGGRLASATPHHPPHPDHRPGPDRLLGPRLTLHLPRRLALGNRLEHLFTRVCGPPQPPRPDHPATTATTRTRKTPTERSVNIPRQLAMDHSQTGRESPPGGSPPPADRWIEAKCAWT